MGGKSISSLLLATFLAASILSGESMDLCEECICRDLHPYLIDCSSLHLKNHYMDDDWFETLKRNNISSDVLLDVRLDHNKIERIFKFPPLNISVLSFANNSISEIDSSAFSELKNLTYLDLSYNKLVSDSLPETSFLGAYNGTENYFPLPIKFLSLAGNSIHSIQPDVFDHMPFLETLDLSRNPLKTLSGTTSQAISQLRNLRVLDLAKTGIKKLPEGMLHDLRFLESLILAENEFTEVPAELEYSHRLSTLVLDGNKISTLDESSFVGLDNLRELDINAMPTLKKIEHDTFGPLKTLRRLKCAHNPQLTFISDAAFRGIVNDSQYWPVTQIFLNDNALTRLDKELANWEFVEEVNVQNNPFICDCKIQWMAEVLVPEIVTGTPALDLNIICAEPESMRGKSLVSLSYEHEDFIKCSEGKGELSASYAKISYEFQSISVVILSLGILLIVIGLSILGVIIVKRRAIARSLERYQPIRYEADVDYRDVTSQSGTLKI